MVLQGTKIRFAIIACFTAAACVFSAACLASCEEPAKLGTSHTDAEVAPVGAMRSDSDGPVYVLVEDIRGDAQIEYTLDEFGNPVTCTKTWPRSGGYSYSSYDGQSLTYEYADPQLGLDFWRSRMAGSHDPKDVAFRTAGGRAYETPDVQVTYEVSRGKALKRHDSGIVCDFEYYPSGRIKSISPHVPNRWEGKVQYDEAGYVISTDVVSDTLSPYFEKWTESRPVEWEFDAEGRPVAYTLGAFGNRGAERYTVETDEVGNIVRVYNEKGGLVRQMAYQRVDTPSYWVRLWSGVFPW